MGTSIFVPILSEVPMTWLCKQIDVPISIGIQAHTHTHTEAHTLGCRWLLAYIMSTFTLNHGSRCFFVAVVWHREKNMTLTLLGWGLNFQSCHLWLSWIICNWHLNVFKFKGAVKSSQYYCFDFFTGPMHKMIMIITKWFTLTATDPSRHWSVVILVTLVIFLLWRVKMSAVKKTYIFY